MKRFLSLVLFFLLTSFAIAQKNEYRIGLNNPKQGETIKYIQEKMFNIFDAMPLYNSDSNVFTVKTKYDITKETLTQKMLDIGFTLISFTNTVPEEPTKNEKVD